MALAIDSQMAASAGAGVSATATLTFAFNNVAGTYMLVGVSWGEGAVNSISAVSYNAVGMGGSIVTVSYDGATHNFAGCAFYGLLTPATGSHNVVVNLTTSSGSTGIEAGAITFTGHDLVTPIVAGSGKTNFRESSAATATVVSGATTVGNLVVAQMTTGTAYSSVSTGTLSWSKNQNTNSAGGAGAMTYASGTGGTITMTDNITSDFMGMVCLEVAAASGGGGGATFPQLERGISRGVNRGVGTGIARSFVRRDRIFVPAYAVLGDLQAAA